MDWAVRSSALAVVVSRGVDSTRRCGGPSQFVGCFVRGGGGGRKRVNDNSCIQKLVLGLAASKSLGLCLSGSAFMHVICNIIIVALRL